MKHQTAISDSMGNKSVVPKKAPYRSPVLHVFGSVSALTMTGQGSGNDGGTGTMQMVSDRNAKEHIVRIGNHPLGIGVYLFDYTHEFRDVWGHGRQFGVMADEVEAVMPEAVTTVPGGYKMVNCAMLGIRRNIHHGGN